MAHGCTQQEKRQLPWIEKLWEMAVVITTALLPKHTATRRLQACYSAAALPAAAIARAI
jgi:hypothetical protein